MLYDHPLEMDLTARIKEANDQGKPPLDIHVLPRDKHWQKLLHSLIAELKPEMSGPALAVIENLEKASEQELEQMASALFASDFASVSSDKAPFILGRALPLLGANGQLDSRQSPRGIR